MDLYRIRWCNYSSTGDGRGSGAELNIFPLPGNPATPCTFYSPVSLVIQPQSYHFHPPSKNILDFKKMYFLQSHIKLCADSFYGQKDLIDLPNLCFPPGKDTLSPDELTYHEFSDCCLSQMFFHTHCNCNSCQGALSADAS